MSTHAGNGVVFDDVSAHTTNAAPPAAGAIRQPAWAAGWTEVELAEMSIYLPLVRIVDEFIDVNLFTRCAAE